MEPLEARLLLAAYDGPMPNVGMELRALHADYLKHLEEGVVARQSAFGSDSPMLVQDGAVYSTIRTSGDLSDVLSMLSDAGFQLMATAARSGIVEGYLPLGALESVAAASGVVSVMPVIVVQVTDSQGSVANEAEGVLLADSAKGLFDVNGAGVTVGVISDSADQVGGGLAASVATGNLPPGIPTLRPEPATGTDEGRAMLELIHDIAPGAALAFASGLGGDIAMAAAINALVAHGATIIVDDLNGLTTEPFFEDGLAAQAVTTAVASGVTYFSSAGNRGTSGYEAPLRLKDYSTDPFPSIPTLNAGRYHDWNGADDLTQTITLGPGVTTIVFQYDEPFGGVVSDFDVFLLNAAGTQILEAGLEFNPATGEPREFLAYDNTTGAPITAQLVIQEFGGNSASRFKWIGFNAPVVGEHLDVAGALNNPHNPGHGGTQDAISVAAAWWQTPLTVESSSSRGPVTRSLDTAGNAIPLQIIDKPVVTAVDGTSTSVPGFTAFYGTSAAAPNAAAVAALVKSFDPTLTPLDLRNTLMGSALDIAPAGFDFASGAGLVQAVDALLVITGGELPLVGDRDFVNQDDTFVLVAHSGDSSLLDVSLNGTFLGSVAMSKLTKITVNGLGGSDTLVVDQSRGLITVPIEYEGGVGASDRLVHTGNPGVPLEGHYTLAPDTATGHAGVLSYNSGAVTISFAGLEPVEDLVPAATLTIDDTTGVNTINVVDGGLSSVADPLTGVAETTYEVNFGGLAESIQFRNKGVVTVNGLGGDDVLTVDIGPRSTADALTRIVLAGGAGADTVNVRQSRIGQAAGAVFSALAVQTGADADTITIVPSTAATNARVTDAVTVDGGGGAGDVLVVDDRLSTTPDPWTVTGTSLTRPSFGGATYTGVASVTLLAQNTVGATVNVLSTSVATTVNAGGGDDTLNVGGGDLSGISGNLTLIGGPGADQIVVSDASRAAPATYGVTPTAVTGPNAGSIIYDASTERLTLQAGAGADVIHVAPSLGTAYTIAGNDPVFFTDPGDQLIVDLAGPGSGTLLITGPGAGTISFPGGYQTVTYTSIEQVSGIHGDLGLVIEGDANANEFRVALDPSGADLQVFRDGVLQLNAPKNAVSSLTVRGLAGDDVLIIDGQHGLPTLAGTLAGYDNPNILGAPSLLFDGGADADRVVFTNLPAGFDQTYAIGDGIGGGSGATTSEGEILTSAGGAVLQMYFVGLEPALTTSAGGSTLTVIGDPTNNVFQIVPSPLIAGGTRIQETAGPYESFDFAPGAFTTLRVYGHDGADLLDLIELGTADATLSLIVLDGRRDTLGDDNAADTLRVRDNTRGGDGAGVAVELYGGGGDDQFLLFDAGSRVDDLLGPVLVDGNAGDDTLIVDDSGSAGPSETVTITATTIAGITGLGGTGGVITYLNLDAGRVRISMNDAGHTVNIVSTAAGLTETELNTGGGDDTINIDDDLGNPFVGTANGVVSPINLHAQGGDDVLNIVDLSDANANQYHMDATTIGGGNFGAAVTSGGIFGPEGILFYDADLEAIDVSAGDGANEFNIDATGVGGAAPMARVTITDGAGSSAFNIQADQLAAGADHTFNGQDAPDVFNVYLASGAVVTGASVQINGQRDDDDTSRRDFVRVLDGGGARAVAMAYQSAVSGDVVIGIDSGTPLDIRTTEQVLFAGDAANDDVVTVFGTAGDDDLTVAPLSASAALIFLNGNPWDGPSDVEPFGSAYPGVAGGGSGPDILVQGVRQTGLTLDGNGAVAGDQLYVYAPSEDPVVDPATTISPFDLLGVGVIVPGFGVGNAYDKIAVTDARVAILNGAVGALLDVNIDVSSFVQVADDKVHGLIVNAGFEALPGAAGLADDIYAVASYNFAIKINGGDPVPGFAPRGDRLSAVTPGEINVFSDKSTPPEVTITTTDPVSSQTSKGLSFSSIENVILTPGLTSQTVNLVGDNNDPEVDQNDHFVVVGADVDSRLPSLAQLAANPDYNPTGAPVDPRFDVDTDGDNEFYLWINGSSAIAFRNVVYLNVYGDDQNPAPGTPSAGPRDIDTLEITPYADNTPTGWGIDVRFDEGNPVQADGAAADLLIYHTALHVGVSENIVVQPSGPERGELRVTNGAFGTPIVTISYTTNLDLVVLDDDGDPSDTDTLTLRGTNPDNVGTSGAELVTADFTATGDAANPLVVVADANPINPLQPILYRLRDMQGFRTITIDTLGGVDRVDVAGRDDGSLLVRVVQSETVALPGVADGNDVVDVFPGAASDAGYAWVQRAGASAVTRVEYVGTRNVVVDGGGGSGFDQVAIHGNDAGNAFELTGTTPTGGTVTMDAWPRVTFDHLGSGGGGVSLDGLGGDDTFAVGYIHGWQVTSVRILGGASVAGDRVLFLGTTGQDVLTFTPTAVDAASLMEASSTTLVRATEIESVAIDGRRGNDGLTIATAAGNNVIDITPGVAGDAGDVRVDSLVPMSFTNLGAGGLVVAFDSSASDRDTLRYNGTAGADAFTVADGVIYLNARVPVTAVDVTNYHLRGLGGDDSFTILSPSGIDVLVEGGEPSGSDTLNFARDARGALPVLVRLDADKTGVPFVQTIQQVGYGVVTHTGIEQVNLDVEDGELYVSGTRGDDIIEFTPLSPDSGLLTAAHIPTAYLIDGVPPTHPLVITGGGPGRGGPASGGFADKVVYHGTNGADLLRVDTASRTISLAILGVGQPAPVIESWRSIQLDDGTTPFGEPGVVEVLDVLGHDGGDTIVVVPAASVGNGLYVNVDGGSPRASDALVIGDVDAHGNPIPLAATDFVVVGQSRVPDAGNILVFQSGVRRPSIAYDNVEIVSPLVASGDHLLILGPDLYEPNEFRETAAYLGAGPVINARNLAIFPNRFEHYGVPADQDYFRVVAAQTGILDFQVYFRMFDSALLPAAGDLSIEVLDASGAVIGGNGTFGNHDTTPNARVRIPAVAGQSYYLHVSGANGDVVNGYDLSVFNTAPPVPYDIELVDLPVDPHYDGTQVPPANNSDTGRSHFDNVTMDASPGIIVRLDDGIFRHDLPGNPSDGTPPDEVIPIPFNPSLDPASTAAGYRVAIYVEGDPQQPGISPQTVIGYAQPGPVEGVYFFDFDDAIVAGAVALTDGSHFISARVEIIDPASAAQRGYGARSASLEIVVDTTPPEILSVGVVDDDACPWAPENVTNDRTPSFYGFAEANAIIRFYLDSNNNGTLEPGTDFLLGLTVAVPTDGDNQFPEGYFEFTSPVDLYDPMFGLPANVPRLIFATAEDLAGNVSSAADAQVAIFVDAIGPQITRVIVTGHPSYDLFDPKPSTDGPTPLVYSLTIDVRDLPNRLAPDFLYPALVESIAEHPGHYSVIGDANGIIAIESVTFVSAPIISGQPARGSIILTFFQPLPDDRYTLTVSDALIDPACNQLDGESNAVEPQENPLFPTGDGVPGGDFVARFTVDSRPEIAVWGAGNVWVDTNGNFQFDPDNVDATNRDIIYQMGYTSDDIFAGNFVESANGVADGFDKLAAYGKVGSSWRWLIDTDNDGVANIERVDPLNINGLPVAGNFDGKAANGDEVGVFTGTTWYFDRNHDFRLDSDTALVTSMRGYPIVGDFDGDGFDDLATYTDSTFQVDLAHGTVRGWDGVPDYTFQFGYIGVRARPVAADMDMDGYDDFGLWLPDRPGQLPREIGEWNFLISGGASVLNRIDVDPITGQSRVRFTPVPFGNDIYAAFGDDFALPVVGNFDPPVSARGGQPAAPPHTNPRQPLDVNNDGVISPIDALIPINYLNRNGGHRLTGTATGAPYLDVNGDGFISAIDALQVINYLNRSKTGIGGAGEGEADAASFAADGASLGSSDLFAATSPAELTATRDAAWLLLPGAGGAATTPSDAGGQADSTPVVTSTVLSVGYLPFDALVSPEEALPALMDIATPQRTPSTLDETLDQLVATPHDDFVAAVDAFFRGEE